MEKYSFYILCVPMAFFFLALSFVHHAITSENPWLKFSGIIFTLICLAFVGMLIIRYYNDLV